MLYVPFADGMATLSYAVRPRNVTTITEAVTYWDIMHPKA